MRRLVEAKYEDRFSLLDFIPIMGKIAVLWLVWQVSTSGAF